MEIILASFSGFICFLLAWAALNVATALAFRHLKKEMPWYVILPLGILAFCIGLGFGIAFYFIWGMIFGSSSSAA